MTKQEYIDGFLESFDPNTFNKYDYAFQSSYMDNVDNYFSRIQDAQNKINSLQKVIDDGGASGTQYNAGKSIYTKILNDWQADYNSFLRNPASQLTAYPKAISEAKAQLRELKKDPNPSAKTLRLIAAVEKQIKGYEEKYQQQIETKTAGYEKQLQEYKDKVQSFNDDEVKYAQEQLPELQKTIDSYAKDIGELNAMSLESVQKRMATDLEYFINRLDVIDQQEALKQKELTGKGAQDGIDLDYIAARDKSISDIYDSINDRVGKLTSYAANYGVKVPDALVNPETIRDFYASTKDKVTEDNTLADILGEYTSELINPYVRDEVVAINEADPGTSLAPGVVDQINEIFGSDSNFTAPPPSSESEEVLRMFAANPQQEKVIDTRTAEERIAEMQANAPKPGAIPEAPLNYGAVDWRERTSAPDYVGQSGLTREQANDLARQFLIYGNFTFVDDQGRPTFDQTGRLSDEILNFGWDTVFKEYEPYANFLAYPKNYIDRGVAEQFARDLAIRGGYTIDEGTVTGWANTIQSVGFDEGAKRYAEVNPGVSGSPLPNAQDMTNYINANNQALSDLTSQSRTTFNQNVAKIIGGEDFSLGTDSITKQEYIDFILNGKDPADLDEGQIEGLNSWKQTYDTLGPEGAIGRWNTLYPNRQMSFAEPQQPFQPDITGEGTTTPGTAFEPDIYGGGEAPTPPGTTSTTTPTTATGAREFAFRPGEISGYTPVTMEPSEEPPLFGEETTFQPAPYTPPPLLTAPPPSPTLSPAQQVIGAPAIERPVGAPMQALTPEQAGSQFVEPTQQDYFAYFGYTPEQLNEAQYLAELEGAPRAGVGAQTVPVLPPAVPGALRLPYTTAPTDMREGGSVSGLKAAAQELQAQGRGGDTILAHINPQEAAMLKAMGGSGTINPKTGLREFIFGRGGIDINIGKKSQKILVPVAAAIAAPYLPAIAGSTAVTAGILAGAGTMLGGGSLQQGLQTGLMAGLSASAAQGMGYEGVPGVDAPGQVAGTGGSAMGAGVQYMPSLESQNAIYNTGANTSLLGKATDYLANIPSAVGEGLSNMDWKDATMLGYLGLSAAGLKENQNAQKEYEQYLAGLAQEKERKRRVGEEAFARTLGAVPVKSGGLIALAGGGMTYAEGGGTTGPTNEPRMVKGTGDGMSDSVPATIEGVQEARLANDEFVIPADVVADLGNGSSSAGAQQLYDMMDRIRQARHGTTEQPPEINARKMMPA